MRCTPMRRTPLRCTPENPLKSVALSDAACLRIRIQTLNCSSPFVVNLKCFTCCDSGFQMPNLKTFSFPGGEIPSCLYKVPDLDGESSQLLIEVTPPPD